MSLTLIRIEAEAMRLTNYRVESGKDSASGNALIRLLGAAGSIGYASYTFAGASGIYDIELGYYDENDGVATLSVSVGNTTFPTWRLNQNLGSSESTAQTLVHRVLASGVSVNQGQSIQIKGVTNHTEYARVDYIDFIPRANVTADNTIINQERASKGVLVNLAQGFSFKATYGNVLKIMPLGDSITYGVKTTFAGDTESGGYRTNLWQRFVDTDGLKVDFVGSLSNGPSSLTDKNHEGHRGFDIEKIAQSVGGWLSTAKPDVVMLMIGTNNTDTDSASVIGNKLGVLIDQITSQLPASQLLVASIPPIDPTEMSATRVQRAVDFNEVLPDIVSTKAAQGKKVSFVDMRSLTVDDLASSTSPEGDNGLHLNSQGYSKVANFWHDAVLNKAGDKKTVSQSVKNIIGSRFDDTLIGNTGNNQIQGGFGKDTLKGGGGSDTFSYQSPNQGGDKITDFSQNDNLSISASGFGGGLKEDISLNTVASKTGTFISGANPVPRGSSANFLYSDHTGFLSFDQDGIGPVAAVKIIDLSGAPSLRIGQLSIVK